jgi:hypothetical protein
MPFPASAKTPFGVAPVRREQISGVLWLKIDNGKIERGIFREVERRPELILVSNH